MKRTNFLFIVAAVIFLSSAASSQVPTKEKVVACAKRGFEKYTKAYGIVWFSARLAILRFS